MRWLLAVVGLSIAALAIGLGSTVAKAGNGAVTTHFSVAYLDPNGAFDTCSGERIVKVAPKPVTMDSETCIVDTSAATFVLPPGTYPVAAGDWFSDFDGAVSVSGTGVVRNHGPHTQLWQLVVYY
ncbi:MAG: hypothetical protein ACXVQQ_04235 [Gaiellaceae bacterium]